MLCRPAGVQASLKSQLCLPPCHRVFVTRAREMGPLVILIALLFFCEKLHQCNMIIIKKQTCWYICRWIEMKLHNSHPGSAPAADYRFHAQPLNPTPPTNDSATRATALCQLFI